MIKKEDSWLWILVVLFIVLILYLNYNKKDINIDKIDCWLGLLIFLFIILIFILYLNYNIKDYIETNKNNNNITIYLFYAEWCPHCRNFMPEWNKFNQSVDQSKVNIKMVNNCEEKFLCDKYNVDRFPTIIFDNGTNYDIYKGIMTAQYLNNYLSNLL
jgi:thiol-disulfide isomerase/thioredoxin